MSEESYKFIGQLVINKYGDVGMIINYNYIFNTYMVEWYKQDVQPYKTEHQEHKIKEYIANYDLYEEMQIYRR